MGRDLIEPGGNNVYLIEIERISLEHEDVLKACVFGVPDETWGVIKAICVWKPDSLLGLDELINFVASCIAWHKNPKYVSFLEVLPKKRIVR